ncbi:hypothetical protein [Sphingobacterium chungjuense]|uniref:hypothetical protein n=1 Tax=Sphingobacterium chungjuense TaxID=2675553 RepID=UPI0014094BF8|nr:hypothetical protein [Sphingobacterium chungjuense]
MIQVFISHPTPFNNNQDSFLKLLKKELEERGLNPVNLGKNNWSFKSPMQPIKELMIHSKAVVVVGLERFHDYIGYAKQHSKYEVEYVHKFRSSSWIQIEAGMAYMVGIPILILKEKNIEKEGILDPNVSEFYVFEFDIEEQLTELSEELKAIIDNWSQHISTI